MNDANFATYDVINPKTRLDRSAGRTLYEVREDPDAYTPDVPLAKLLAGNPQARAAAADHAKHLHKAERLLDEALNLTGLTLTSLADECDGRAMQTETALRVIEKKLNKAHAQIDRHRRQNTRLFLAHFDLNAKTDATETN